MINSGDRIRVEEQIESYAWTEAKELIKPAYNRGSIADIPSKILEILGVAQATHLMRESSDAVGSADHLIFLLIDGMGHYTIDRCQGSHGMPNLLKFLIKSQYDVITSTFPSTTSTATVTYHTGMDPEKHGVIGYLQFLKNAGTVCNMINLTPLGMRNRSLLDFGRALPQLNRWETIHEKLRDEDIASYLYQPEGIKNSGLTRITAKGSIIRPYYTISQMISNIASDIINSSGPTFHFCYISTVDTISHHAGPFTADTASEIDTIFHLLENVLAQKVSGTATGIMISADHGHIEVGPRNNIDSGRDEILRKMLSSPVAGDERAPVLRSRTLDIEDLKQHLQKYYPGFMAMESSKLIKDGFFGRTGSTDLDSDLFGDIVMIPVGPYAIYDSYLAILDSDMAFPDMVGMHGGLSREEMIVPLISRNF